MSLPATCAQCEAPLILQDSGARNMNSGDSNDVSVNELKALANQGVFPLEHDDNDDIALDRVEDKEVQIKVSPESIVAFFWCNVGCQGRCSFQTRTSLLLPWVEGSVAQGTICSMSRNLLAKVFGEQVLKVQGESGQNWRQLASKPNHYMSFLQRVKTFL